MSYQDFIWDANSESGLATALKHVEIRPNEDGNGLPITHPNVSERKQVRILIRFQNTQSGGWRGKRLGLVSYRRLRSHTSCSVIRLSEDIFLEWQYYQ